MIVVSLLILHMCGSNVAVNVVILERIAAFDEAQGPYYPLRRATTWALQSQSRKKSFLTAF